MKKTYFILILTILTACSVKLSAPKQSDVDRVSIKYPGYSLIELNEGKTLFEQTCNRCHRLKNPTSRDEKKWSEIVPKMVARLNKKEGKEVVDEKQKEAILRYLITMSSATRSVN